MKYAFGTAVLALALAGCGGSATDADADGDGNVTSEEISAAASKIVKPKAGKYSSKMTLVDVEIPGAPPEMIKMMKDGMSDQTTESCMTEEEAEKGFEEMAKEMQNGDCTTQKFVVNGGDIDAEMTCKVEGQGEMKMTMDGTGTETSMDMKMTMEGDMPGMGQTKMVMNVESKRIGDCDA